MADGWKRDFATLLLACGLPLVLVARSQAGDWPQILGPERNGKASGEKLAATWPAGGPRKLWTHKLGSGYAGPAVVGERVIVFHRIDDSEIVEALDATSGKPVWKATFEANYRGGVQSRHRTALRAAGCRRQGLCLRLGGRSAMRFAGQGREVVGAFAPGRSFGRRRLLRRCEHADLGGWQTAGECRRPRRGNRRP